MAIRSYSARTGLTIAVSLTLGCAAMAQTPMRTAPPAPTLAGDAADDAAGLGQMFESISAPSYTEYLHGSESVVLADFNKDGLTDIFAVYDETQTAKMFLNTGNFTFKEHTFTIKNGPRQPTKMGRQANIANAADFNKDGFLDILIGYSQSRSAGLGNMLLISDGAFDRFDEVSEEMGVRNTAAYNRQTSIADVNRDGWLDIAVGADNIGTLNGGQPQQRLYVFKPTPSGRFADGTFQNIGGTDLTPGFGAEFACNPDIDMAAPGITLRDVDNDGDLDMMQNYHSDMFLAKWDSRCPSGEYRQGPRMWRNMLAETGVFRFDLAKNNGFTAECRNRYDRTAKIYVPEGHCAGLPYLFYADLDNNGTMDILATGASDITWHVNTDQITSMAWRNLGGMKFEEATGEMGLEALNWTYGQWSRFWKADLPYTSKQLARSINSSSQPSRMIGRTLHDGQPYGSDIVIADFDNDGWQDLVYIHKHEIDGAWGKDRSILFMNQRDGTFRPTTTQFSGIDSNGPSGEAADLNNDGLLDLVLIADPLNSGPTADMPKDRFRQRIMWNTGVNGAKDNHWIRLRFSRVGHAALTGARIEARTRGKLLGTRWIFSNHDYKSGGSLEAHFGLGQNRDVDLTITLLDGTVRKLPKVAIDQFLDVDMTTGKTKSVKTP